MATIMIRYSLSQESFRNILAQEETRETAVRDILAEFGFTFLNMYFSSSKASFIVLADGDPMRVPALEMMYLASGAYVGCECEVLHSPAEVKEQKKLARAVSPKFDAPLDDNSILFVCIISKVCACSVPLTNIVPVKKRLLLL